ncbi:2-amino-3-ketobutyrate coenzyme A ligase, mitochondrial [Venturia canescens]|uniref:2-amino-3-ketobutyrate coenzyme A ligase, mitochondrial n=1 Tax=Venturia canescens TaxID=32260 RepID=UPI001C9BC9BC|nr:2-amino-3-ketobutyrate coenzyme A ligase, mitochondrial [Venturia canescens]
MKTSLTGLRDVKSSHDLIAQQSAPDCSTELYVVRVFICRTKMNFPRVTALKFKAKQGFVRNANNLAAFLKPELRAIEDAGTWKHERIIASPQRTEIALADGSKVLNFCANNYLGLADNKHVIDVAKNALDEYGAGLSSVRFICGTQKIHRELEQRIADFHGREAAIIYPSCFDANAGLFESFLTPDDAVISDELNHASIIDGIRLCKAKKYRFKHRDMADLESKLKESSGSRLRLIATDGVFSMDGTVAPLSDIIALAKAHNALTFVDDCHATGFFGKTGRGSEEYCNQSGAVDIINSTLGKALGGAAGGYTTGPKELIDLLRQKSRPYLFSNSLPPPVVATGIQVLKMLSSSSSSFLDRLTENTMRFRRSMVGAGFTISGDNHPISPVMLGDAKLATNFADKMLRKGIYVIGFSYPVVPKGKARIRVQISAAHTKDDIDLAVNAFIEVGKELGVIQ